MAWFLDQYFQLPYGFIQQIIDLTLPYGTFGARSSGSEECVSDILRMFIQSTYSGHF